MGQQMDDGAAQLSQPGLCFELPHGLVRSSPGLLEPLPALTQGDPAPPGCEGEVLPLRYLSRGGLCLLLGRSCGQFTSVSNRSTRVHEYTHTLCDSFPCISVYTVNTEILFPFLTNFVHKQKVQFCSFLG